jgi:hypothetical protein
MTINNNNIFGAFTLNEARGSRLTGDWLNKESVANYGWFGGGISAGTPLATVDRIDFSNDSVTATARSPLSLARYTSGATGNSNYGWFGGGQPGSKSTVDRIDYSNDSSTASPRGPLSLARYQFIATGNSNYGWFGGGRDTPSTSVSTVDRIDFSNDASTASPRGPLSGSRYDPAAIANSNYGWFGGGYNPPSPGSKSTVDRIDFSNDSSTATARGPLSVARRQSAATGNSNYGWFGGGRNTIILSTVERIDFSNDLATASPRGGLLNAPAGIYLFAATGNSNYGWFGGGLNGPTPVATVDRIDFSNDSVTASPRGALTSPGRYGLAATSGVLNIRRQKAANFGWFGGGAFPPVATVDRIDFSNDLVSALARGSLTLTRTALSATGNSNYGWFGGGYNPSLPTPERFTRIVDRIDFSNDSPSTLTRGPLSAGRAYLAATGNSNYGWFGGGRGPGSPIPLYTTVDRIDFSNDSSTALPRGSLTSPARYAL